MNHRIIIVELFEIERKASDIIRDTDYALRTGYQIASNIRPPKKIHSLRNDKIHTNIFLAVSRLSIAPNLSKKMATLGKKRNVTKNYF